MARATSSLLAFVLMLATARGDTIPKDPEGVTNATDEAVSPTSMSSLDGVDKNIQHKVTVTVAKKIGNISDDFPKWIDEWAAPVEIRQWFPCYLTGHDVDSVPVAVIEYGNWKFSEALRHGNGTKADMRQLFFKYYNQTLLRLQREGRANNSQGVGFIFDWNGFTLANYADPVALELGLYQFSTLDQLQKVLNYVYMINTNFAAETFIRLAKPFIGNIMEKCEIFGTQRHKWLPYLLRRIPKSQLPHWYGGDTEGWQPVWVAGVRINQTLILINK